MSRPEGMIDIHSHVLWGMDDGAQSLADSLEMCRIAYGDGIRTIVATPHTLNGVYGNARTSVLAKVRQLNTVIRNRLSVTRSDNQFHLRILPGSDVHLCERTLCQLKGGGVTTLGDGGKCLLLEFPVQGIPHGSEKVLFQLIAMGILPVISHPERNLEIGENPRRYYQMIRMGCLGQLTAMSLTGGFGPGVTRVAERLLAAGLVHFIASDAHSTDGRPPILSPAVRAAAPIVGEEEALRMVTTYPRAILEGRRPDFPEPKPVE